MAWRQLVKVSTVLGFLALLTLATFAALWLWIAVDLWTFTASKEQPRFDVDDDLVEVASLFGTTVAVGTAAVLGIEIRERKNRDGLTRLGQVLSTTLTPLLALGVFAYGLVGATVLAAWLTNRGVAPDVVKAFAMTFAGWIAGGFAAVFKAAT